MTQLGPAWTPAAARPGREGLAIRGARSKLEALVERFIAGLTQKSAASGSILALAYLLFFPGCFTVLGGSPTTRDPPLRTSSYRVGVNLGVVVSSMEKAGPNDLPIPCCSLFQVSRTVAVLGR